MWDMCTKQKCRFFVLTNYYQWVFGCFSEGWTSGFCTVVHSTENRDPSLLETLLFWVVSSMQLPDTSSFVIPKVGNEALHIPGREVPCVLYDVMGHDIEMAVALSNLTD